MRHGNLIGFKRNKNRYSRTIPFKNFLKIDQKPIAASIAKIIRKPMKTSSEMGIEATVNIMVIIRHAS
jgi:hypothetical protein